MIVLGIADNHDAGAALVVDGRLRAAVNQERIDRVKHSGAFPWGAIDATLDVAGVRARDVDRVVVGTGFTPSTLLRMLPEVHHSARSEGQFSPLLHAYVVYQSILRKTGLHSLEVDASKALLRQRLRLRRFGRAHITMMDHHVAHAHAAYRTQPRDPVLVLTVDAMGDGTTATVSVGRNGDLVQIYRQSGLACVNSFYSKITELLGFTAIRHEGKITGLAALAEPPPELLRHFSARVRFAGPGFARNPAWRVERPDDDFWSVVPRWSREQVAAAAQRTIELAVTDFLRHWIAETGLRDVAVAGGIFANVKLNQRLAELPELDSLWVVPHMGDGGLAAGAALGSVGAMPRALPSAFLGPGITDRDAFKALERGGLPRDRLADRTSPFGTRGDIERVSALLANGNVVARATGAMEWGPRALGHRSVLARVIDPAITDWLNGKLRRTEFMPFAPVVRAEDAGRFFVGLDKAEAAARFMTVCFDCTPEFRELAPAAVHVDGTARPQIVDEDSDPDLHAVLTRVGELSGVPVLINTSFNLHEEPICCTASDAVRAMREAELDALWMGPFVSIRPRF
jgi:carbamoyltransferase